MLQNVIYTKYGSVLTCEPVLIGEHISRSLLHRVTSHQRHLELLKQIIQEMLDDVALILHHNLYYQQDGSKCVIILLNDVFVTHCFRICEVKCSES